MHVSMQPLHSTVAKTQSVGVMQPARLHARDDLLHDGRTHEIIHAVSMAAQVVMVRSMCMLACSNGCLLAHAVCCVCLHRIDNHFPGDWIVAHNNWLWGNYTAAKEALAQSILANVTTTLKDVKTIIGQLTQLGTIGMPAGSLNAFLESYPLQKCDALNPITTAAAAGSTASLKGDGAVPLPAGAVLTPAAPATAAAMVAPKAAAGGNRKMLL